MPTDFFSAPIRGIIRLGLTAAVDHLNHPDRVGENPLPTPEFGIVASLAIPCPLESPTPEVETNPEETPVATSAPEVTEAPEESATPTAVSIASPSPTTIASPVPTAIEG